MGLAFLEKVGNTSTSGGGTGSGDGLEIKGIIEEYYVYTGDNITPGSFVEFVQGVGNRVITPGDEVATDINFLTIPNSWSGPTASSANKFSVIMLEDKQRIVIFYNQSNATHAQIVKIVDGVVTLAEESFEIIHAFYQQTPILLSNNRIALIDDYYKSIIIWQVNDDMTMEEIAEETIPGNVWNISYRTFLKLSDTKFFLTYCSSSNIYVARVVNIGEDNTITFGEYTLFELGTYPSTSDAGTHYSLDMGNNTIITFVPKQGEVSIWTVSGDDVTIAAHHLTGIITSDHDSFIVKKLDGNKFMMVYSLEYIPYAQICTLENMTITCGEPIVLVDDDSLPEPGYNMVMEKIPQSNNYLLTCMPYIDDEDKYYAIVFSLEGDTLTAISEPQNLFGDLTLQSYQPYLFFLTEDGSNNFYYIFGADADYDDEGDVSTIAKTVVGQCLYLNSNNQIIEAYSKTTIDTTWETQAKLATSDPFHGIAKTAGVGGDDMGHNEKIQVYTL